MRSIVVVLALTFAGTACAERYADHFVIGAQYRGVVRKDFPGIGRADLAFSGDRTGAFQVNGQGRVTRAGTFFVGSLNLYADRARAGRSRTCPDPPRSF